MMLENLSASNRMLGQYQVAAKAQMNTLRAIRVGTIPIHFLKKQAV